MFVRILNTSLISCYVIVVVMLFRALMLRAERKYVYWLWFMVFINLCIPFRISGPFSLIPRWVANFDLAEWGNAVYLPEEAVVEEVASTSAHNYIPADGNGTASGIDSNSGLASVQDETEGHAAYIPNEKLAGNDTGIGHEYMPESLAGAVPGTDSNTGITKHAYHTDMVFDGRLQKLLAVVWGIGVCVLAAGAICSSVKLQRRLKDAEPFECDMVLAEENTKIKTADGIESPFLWGIFTPVIYLPRRIEKNECKYIVAHERFHQKRRDYLVKPLFFMIAVLHWFNPFVWAAYFLFVRDMEISCDEAVIAAADKDIRKEYAESILKYAARQNGYTLTPITFGEPSLKCRLQNVLYFREHSTFLSVFMLCSVIVLMAGLTAKPTLEEQKDLNLGGVVQWESLPEETVHAQKPNLERQENPSQIEHKPVMTETILNFGEAVLALTDKLAAYMETK